MIDKRYTSEADITDEEKKLIKEGMAGIVEVVKPVISPTTTAILLAIHVVALCVPMWVPITTLLYVGVVFISMLFMLLYSWQAETGAAARTETLIAAGVGKLLMLQLVKLLEKHEKIDGTKAEDSCLTTTDEGTDKVQENK